MATPLIITIGREFGSGGHAIGEELANRFDLPLYDSSILKSIALEQSIDLELLEKYDEVPRLAFLSKARHGYGGTPSEKIAKMQFDFLRSKAEEDESFVVVGRCSETILKGYPGMISIFVLADKAAKIERIARIHQLLPEEADIMIDRITKQRKAYHNYYCADKWGDSRNYDLTINSTRLGIVGTADMIEAYIKMRMAKQ